MYVYTLVKYTRIQFIHYLRLQEDMILNYSVYPTERIRVTGLRNTLEEKLSLKSNTSIAPHVCNMSETEKS